jgi:hypothetical protein
MYQGLRDAARNKMESLIKRRDMLEANLNSGNNSPEEIRAITNQLEGAIWVKGKNRQCEKITRCSKQLKCCFLRRIKIEKR